MSWLHTCLVGNIRQPLNADRHNSSFLQTVRLFPYKCTTGYGSASQSTVDSQSQVRASARSTHHIVKTKGHQKADYETSAKNNWYPSTHQDYSLSADSNTITNTITMHFSTGALALWCVSIGGAAAFSTQGKLSEVLVSIRDFSWS